MIKENISVVFQNHVILMIPNVLRILNTILSFVTRVFMKFCEVHFDLLKVKHRMQQYFSLILGKFVEMCVDLNGLS
jgi:hypothetical protein